MAELATKTDLQAVAARFDARLDNLSVHFDTKLDNLSLRLTVRLGVMLAAGVAALSALIKLI